MQLAAFLDCMTPTIYQALREAIELGKWADGRKLSADEQAAILQALIVYEVDHIAPSERIGFMPTVCQSQHKSEEAANLILHFQNESLS